jgi:Mycothiol maleylpyruvate isomerase N-terminal domain
LSAQSTAYAPDALVRDCAQLARILTDFFGALSSGAWDRPTERKPGAWTLRETLAHVTAAASALYEPAMNAALLQQPFNVPGLASQADLFAYNTREIATRKNLPPETLIQTLIQTLARAAQCASSLRADQLALTITLPYLSRPLSVVELIGNQLAHPGITHGAQLANGTGVAPLWTQYTPDFLHRQLTRFFVGQMSPSYSARRGGSLKASINFGAGSSGRWHINISPAGGVGGEGDAPRAAFTIRARSTDVLCRLITQQLNPWIAVLRVQALAWGDLRLAMRLLYLFLPS